MNVPLTPSCFTSFASNVKRVYPESAGKSTGVIPSFFVGGTTASGWLVNVIVPPFLMSYSFVTLYSTASVPVPNVNLPCFSSSIVSVGLSPG